ncbi:MULTISPECIES: arylamine N-acetyltransferase [unclassified Caulobacter]|uniref:arylamine N-acetyltransferase family protein n=1 Tax=unclassified Caulobacter TaxID=2648921 RepID=UPI0006F63E23|nr:MULTISPECIES: arylamine N-acetyltransferase [unclassified Caulobacter]KQV57692.1 N-hydroxyarylamine O-acetyltransferase [Caulobacter sp. Root342]KQV67265.1 N-hydroxyarylamine O-acetyltransferase [Caulobacter sp. Root343]
MFDAPAAAAVDLDAYFARIGYEGPREPTMATLRAITQKHPDAIPFENLDVLLGRGISLAPADIDAKLISAGRGGYCYEQNGLLKRVLETLGFQVEGLMARVKWMLPEDAPPRPRSHQVLGVAIDGETWLADAGFGGCVLTAPLRLFSDAVQDTPNGKFRIVDTETNGVAERQVQADLSGRWAPLYQVSKGGWAEIDYEQANYFTYTHPSSHFTWSMTVGRTTPTARYALKNNRFTHRDITGAVVEQRDLSVSELEATLRDVIGLPVEADWMPVLEKVVAWGTSA